MSIAGARAFLLRKRRPRVVVSRKDRCHNCPAPSFGKSRCPTCMEATIATNRARKARLKAEGLCITCTKPTAGSVRCPACQEKRRTRERGKDAAQAAARRAAGLCTECGADAGGYAMCETHRVARRSREAKRRRAAGVPEIPSNSRRPMPRKAAEGESK